MAAAAESTSGGKKAWKVDSWRSYPIKQQPPYPEGTDKELAEVLSEINELPPLVSAGEVKKLKEAIAQAGKGQAFILQGGDCAERFQDCRKKIIEDKLRILLQMSLVLTFKAGLRVVRIWRGAGQFAKPRSSNVEKLPDGREVASFRGDNVNGFEVDDRIPDPKRLLRAYFHSAATINYIRALVDGGFASLNYPHNWDLQHVKSESLRANYDAILSDLGKAVNLIQTINSGVLLPSLETIDVGTSHEGLILSYEEALTEEVTDPVGPTGFFNLGAHFLWIGDRTRQLDAAHIEYFRGIENPIGVKCGPTMKNDELAALVKVLNSKKEPGRLTLITRYGANKIADLLPGHIKAVQATGIPVTWISDAVHGNTFVTENKVKTRDLSKIWSEIQQAFNIHRELGSVLGGVHLELTGENVTECVGGSQALTPDQLSQHYQTFCDPRLNYTQSLDIAFRLSDLLFY